jgi:hypothetical protein
MVAKIVNRFERWDADQFDGVGHKLKRNLVKPARDCQWFYREVSQA